MPPTAPGRGPKEQEFRVTHPFHPLIGREFDLVDYTFCWGEPRVCFHDDNGRLSSLPAAWTSVGPVDPFVHTAAGRSPFRLEDLLELSEMIRRPRQESVT